jgi:hypothetical protein
VIIEQVSEGDLSEGEGTTTAKPEPTPGQSPSDSPGFAGFSGVAGKGSGGHQESSTKPDAPGDYPTPEAFADALRCELDALCKPEPGTPPPLSLPSLVSEIARLGGRLKRDDQPKPHVVCVGIPSDTYEARKDLRHAIGFWQNDLLTLVAP